MTEVIRGPIFYSTCVKLKAYRTFPGRHRKALDEV